MYYVIDIKTGCTVKTFPAGKLSSALRYADKRDNEYGAYRYSVEYRA